MKNIYEEFSFKELINMNKEALIKSFLCNSSSVILYDALVKVYSFIFHSEITKK